jgi:hypothetical protein
MIRKTQVSFMFLAIVIILVHAIIPHHHHKDIICFFYSSSENEYYQDDDNKQKCHCEHSETEQSEDCALQQIPTITRNNVKQLITENENSVNLLHDTQIDILAVDYVNLLFSTLSYIDYSPKSKYTLLINSSLGLRSPPLAA